MPREAASLHAASPWILQSERLHAQRKFQAKYTTLGTGLQQSGRSPGCKGCVLLSSMTAFRMTCPAGRTGVPLSARLPARSAARISFSRCVRSAPSVPRREVACSSDAAAMPVPSAGSEEPALTGIEKLADRLATLFPLWVFIGATLGITKPEAVTWFGSTLFTYALGFLMMTMGLTLTVADFKKCAERPAPILVGYAAQYFIKPVCSLDSLFVACDCSCPACLSDAAASPLS
jgi:Sodium Bile acid symporter family